MSARGGKSAKRGSGPGAKRGGGKAAKRGSGKSAKRGGGKSVRRGGGKTAKRGSGKTARRGSGKAAQPARAKSAGLGRGKSAERGEAGAEAGESLPIRGAVLGADVSRSRSPVIHQAAFQALGIQGDYQARSVSARGFRQVVTALAADGYRYVNVTIPHKGLAAALATTRSEAVRASGAANTLIFEGGRGGGGVRPRTKAKVRIHAENTDGPGMLAALRDLGANPAEGIAVVVGSGGAAAGAVEALTAVGARVRIIARRKRAALAMRARLPAPRQPRISVTEWTPATLAAALGDADMLISAVPAAAWEAPEACAGLESLPTRAVVLEMAYGAGTALARAVEARGARYADGLGMLVHQAAVAITLALGQAPPLAPMFAAVGLPSRSGPLAPVPGGEG